MSKYITEFNLIGNSIINVDLVCKDWNDRFFISSWINDNEEKYTFIANGKRKNHQLCKTQISKEQAFQVANKLNLIHVKNTTFRSAGSFHTQSFIKSEIERIRKIKREKQYELDEISTVLFQFERSI